MRWNCIASLLALSILSAYATADETIILDLPASQSTTEQSPAKAIDKPSGSPALHTISPGPNRHGGLRQTAPEKIIGRLGIVDKNCSLHLIRSTSRGLSVSVKTGTYLALSMDQGEWFGVLMSDRTTGWILKKYVRVLEFQVVDTSPKTSPATNQAASLNNNPLINGGQKTILETAYGFLGVNYRYGGNNVATGIDCSAFVQRCFASQGIQLPRTAHEQILCGMPISSVQLQPADRLYFASRDGRISHTGIYIGNGYFIHASSSRHGVAVSRLTEPLYVRMYAGARR